MSVGLAMPVAQAWQWEVPEEQSPETKDRLSPDAMQSLVKGPMSVLRGRGLTEAQQQFETLVARAVKGHGKGSVEEADLLTSFGVSLYIESIDRDAPALAQASVSYLERA